LILAYLGKVVSGWWSVASWGGAVRAEGGMLGGKNVENAGNMNFVLLLKVVFHLV
jgi:hypothetical protein